jgi:Holliday junction resolvase RusA-like endonuclease
MMEAATGRHQRVNHALLRHPRRADLDNFNKLSLDALTGIAYADDSQIAELHQRRGYDKVNPRFDIGIEPCRASDA